MAKVTKSTLPDRSQLHALVAEADFLDCYEVESKLSVRDAAEIALEFSGWTEALLALRNIIVAPFGLATSGPEDAEVIGIFPVVSESKDELVVGFDDSHLNFRIGVLSNEGSIYLATWVHPNNVGGRMYLGLVMPFHILIVRNALQRVARKSCLVCR